MSEKEVKHTPGPWELDDEFIVQQVGKPDLGICSVMNMDAGGSKDWYRGSITEANGRLIVAAPNMLHALREAEAALEVHESRIVGDFVPMEVLALRIVRAAIARATS